MWEPYRQRVEALPPRTIELPRRRMLSPEDKDWERKFLEFSRAAGANAKCAVKVDLLQLVVHQKWVLTRRAADYSDRFRNARAWKEISLPTVPERQDAKFEVRSFDFGLRTEIDIDIPDGEWLFRFVNINGEPHLKPGPALKYVTVTQLEENRMLLLSGYHRSYGFVLKMKAAGDGTECPALVALAENVVPSVIPGSETAFDRLVRGDRAPLFADFFDERFAMRVLHRRKRYQMQIRAGIAQIDNPWNLTAMSLPSRYRICPISRGTKVPVCLKTNFRASSLRASSGVAG
jgi:hypothetical protein